MTDRWSTQESIKFVNLYKDQSILWDVCNPYYKSKGLRREALEYLKNEMNLQSIDDVQRKIKSLRSTYFQEVQKIIKGKQIGKDYVPAIKWFDTMDYCMKIKNLKEHDRINLEETTTAVDGIQPTLIQDDSKPEEADNTLNVQIQPTEKASIKKNPLKRKYFADSSSAVELQRLKRFPKPVILPRKDQRISFGQKLDHQKPVIFQIINEPQKLEHKPVVLQKEDECDMIGKYVALQLRGLPLTDMLDAKDEIQQILTKYRKKGICPRNSVSEENMSNKNKEVSND